MMNSKLLSLLVVVLVATLASARRSSPSSGVRAFWGRHHRVSIPKLFDNRQVINNNYNYNSIMESKMVAFTTSSSSSSSTADEDDHVGQPIKKLHTQEELVYLSFHGF
ncbi:unnamed protein product [Cylindrotheca closterium]|uniref:Uncharacterized protein n=1 Tax=Cylindrotheca closterium TaxID=2856 RepID=A0AAD2FMI1_9STRA|nr:unnamed protein product [Cylindrotheca closterium]